MQILSDGTHPKRHYSSIIPLYSLASVLIDVLQKIKQPSGSIQVNMALKQLAPIIQGNLKGGSVNHRSIQ